MATLPVARTTQSSSRTTERRTELALVAVTVAVALGALGVAAALGWPGARVDCRFEVCYCEAARPGWLRQPANTLSNLLPVVLGLAFGAWFSGERRLRAALGRSNAALDAFGLAFPTALAFQGTGAMFFHASLVGWAGVLDSASMFSTASLLFATNLHRAGALRAQAIVPAWLAVTGAGAVASAVAPVVVSPVMMSLFFGILGSEVVVSRRRPSASPWFRRGVALFVTGVGVWTFSSVPGEALCAPRSLLQGHAVWHLTSAAAVSMFALHATADLRGRSIATHAALRT